MAHDFKDYATGLAAAAHDLCGRDTFEETLEAVVETAEVTVPGSFRAGVSITDKQGRAETVAVTDAWAADLDVLQHELGEGPSVDALRHTSVVEVPAARHDQRWPRYMSRAAPAGLRSQLALPFRVDTATAGVLSMYSSREEEIDAAARGVGEVVAAYAGMALARVREIETLNEALDSRQAIGQAVGILMERYGIEEDRAFAFLVRESTTTNTKVRDIAAALVLPQNCAAPGAPRPAAR